MIPPFESLSIEKYGFFNNQKFKDIIFTLYVKILKQLISNCIVFFKSVNGLFINFRLYLE